MLEILGEIYLDKGETEKAKIKYTQAINVLKAFENDFETKYTRSKHDPEKIKELEVSALKCLKKIDNSEFLKIYLENSTKRLY